MRTGYLTLLCAAALAAQTAAAAPVRSHPVEAAYAAIWDGFYGPGRGKALLHASPALLPDGRPDFIVNEKADEVKLRIRLEVATAAFEAWRQDAHRRLAALGAAQCRSVALGAANARIIGGRAFQFSDEGEAGVRSWERGGAAKKAAVAIRVECLSAKGGLLGEWETPIRSFSREGNGDFPFPLHDLNRLLDIPPSIWNWVGDGVSPDAGAEMATYEMSLGGLTPRRAKSVATVRCLIIDEADFLPDLLKTAPSAVLNLATNMVAVPGRGFLMCRHEVTQALWESVMKTRPSRFEGKDLPVDNVSWDDCTRFLSKLNALPIVRLRGHLYRLPDEEEWEYACKAGAEGAFCRMANGTEVTAETLGSVAWFGENSKRETHPVGQKAPNAFGLYDMLGNVWEWTSTEEENDRITKGGGWNGDAGRCESANRNRFFPAHRFPFLGLRLVRETIDPR